jgi:hypothetical protein
MKTNILSQARQQQELILKLLDAVNSDAEYRFLQAELRRLASSSTLTKEVHRT